jgi:hypothetical protein
MKEASMKKAFVLFIAAVVLFGVFAQRADAQNATVEQKIIGTWAVIDGSTMEEIFGNGKTWGFEANGNLTISEFPAIAEIPPNFKVRMKFGVTNRFLAILGPEDYALQLLFTISISSDGKTLFLTYNLERNSQSYIWLAKK